MKSKVLRIAVSVMLIPVALLFGFFAFVYSLFTYNPNFFITLSIVYTILFVLWLIACAIGKWKFKPMAISLAVIVITGIVIPLSYAKYMDYIYKIPTVTEQTENLSLYQPFIKNTKAVKLGEPATLQLTDSLPVIDGATALYPVYAAFVQATYPEKKPDSTNYYNYNKGKVRSSTTPEAYKRLISGESDIIFCAAPSKEQLLQAQETGKKLNLIPIGREAFVFFVNGKNPINGLTHQQIKDIYTGNVRNWKELGSFNKSIRPFQRPEGSGSQTMLLKIMGDEKVMEPLTENTAVHMGQIIEQTASYRNFDNAIGYSFLFYATEMVGNNNIKLLAIDGIIPQRSTIEDGTYPLTGEFYAITLGEPSANTQLLIDWILGEQGRYLIEKTGYTPLKPFPKESNSN